MNENNPSIIVAGITAPTCLTLLDTAGYRDTRRAPDVKALADLCHERPADIIFLYGVELLTDGLTFLATLREADRNHGRYTAVVLCLEDPGTERLRAAFACGIDDYLRLPADVAQARARIATASRIAALETSLLRHPGAEEQGVAVGQGTMLDSLTGVGTRHYLNEQLAALLLETKARGGVSCCVSISVDRWEALTQRYEAKICDELLREVAKRLRKAVRPIDCVSRIGEGEFAVALRYTDSNDARPWIFERMLRTISYPAVKTSAGEVHVTSSIGVCCAEGEGGNSASEMLALATEKVQDARKRGGNTLVV